MVEAAFEPPLGKIDFGAGYCLAGMEKLFFLFLLTCQSSFTNVPCIMNWDWEKLQEKRQRQSGGGMRPPDFEDLNNKMNKLRELKMPGWKYLLLFAILAWLGSGIYIVEPDEVGVVQRFGKYDRTTASGPHFHIPFPVEKVTMPKITVVRRIEIGFRETQRRGAPFLGAVGNRTVPDESLMLTGDENIVDVHCIVQYQISNPEQYLFHISEQEKTVADAAKAALREVIGYNRIDDVLTTGKLAIQTESRDLLQKILNSYQSGIKVLAVQLQDVHPPQQVINAFKDVASAKEDKSRFINEADAYRNDILPKTRGEVAAIVNEAEAYRASVVRRAEGEASRFLAVYKEYVKARDITKKRIYLETMEEIFSNPEVQKLILAEQAGKNVVPYLPLDMLNQETDKKVKKNKNTQKAEGK